MLSYYDGQILNADNDLKLIAYKDTEIYSIYRHFLECPEKCKSIYLMIKYCIFENSIYVTNTPPKIKGALRPFIFGVSRVRTTAAAKIGESDIVLSAVGSRFAAACGCEARTA